MGKQLWLRHIDNESREKQPSCMWGLVHVLDYHHWHSNVKRMIYHRKYEGRTHDKRDLSMRRDDGYEKLLVEQESPHHAAKVSRSSKKRSLRSRIKAIIAEETSKEDKNARGKEGGLSTKSSLNRTYSIHHLESVDDFFGKIQTDWKHPIIFLPTNSASKSSDAAQTKASRGESDVAEPNSKEKPDVFEIFKVDKELLLRHIQDSNESFGDFPRSSLGLNTKKSFSKSRSFPVADSAQGRKLKPMKLESKQTEVWSLPRDEKLHRSKSVLGKSSTQSGLETETRPFESLDYKEEENAVDKIGEEGEGDGVRKRTHRRSSSLNDSLEKYARLFENSFTRNVKLSSSQSLKLASEEGYAPLYLKRRRSHSYADSYYSDVNFEVLGDNPSGASLVVIAEDSSSHPQKREEEEVVSLVASHMESKEDDASLRLDSSNEKNKNEENLEDKSDSLVEKDVDSSDVILKEVQDPGFVSDSDMFMQDTEGKEHEFIHNLDYFHGENLLTSQNLEQYEIKEETIYPLKKITDLDYVRHLLDRSGIAADASDMAWHASDQLFSPQLFEEFEADWPHEEDRLDGWPDFQGCWDHQMLFDLVNEALIEIYDISLPYYPKSLSSSCHVCPFPKGDRIIEEVCSRVSSLMNVKPEEKQVLDSIVGRDLARDRSWMNLQLESESIALYVEEMLFDELLQEVVFS